MHFFGNAIDRFRLRREKLPPHVSRHKEHGLVYIKEDSFACTVNQIDEPSGDGFLEFLTDAETQGSYLLELNEQFPGLFPAMYGFTDSDKKGYIMEYIPGPTLSDYADSGHEVPTELLHEIFTARDQLHEAGYAHGDFKTNNVILRLNTEGRATGFRFIDPVPPVVTNTDRMRTREDLVDILQSHDLSRSSEWEESLR
ncbi:MAG: hypothetical protein TR69_WS6001000034 [candidate division WS6 bacterium OLB20]|uniref:Uncharacterized protein n=1 Tax=candidate division WS6 bacterium OLB20 TaxID=1617426 RepID=A0A136M116_9BACT|nr:MAG: hypothetical protein TR69_WS6001000034 [candidate division WS6 bacterium OLB20]